MELEWQDEKDLHIHQLENPTPQINAQMTQAAKHTRYEILYAKAQSQAENAIGQLNLIKDNLGQSITNRALDTLKSQIAISEAEIDDNLWTEYEDLLELKSDHREALTGKYAAHRRQVKEASAALLTLDLTLLLRPQHQMCPCWPRARLSTATPTGPP